MNEADELSVRVWSIDGSSQVMSVLEFAAEFVEEQRIRRDELWQKSQQEVEELDLDAARRLAMLDTIKEFLDGELKRIEREVYALSARGMRSDREPLH